MNYRDSIQHESRFLSLTGYTPHEFHALLPYFVTAWEELMDSMTLTGYPRTGRTYTPYRTCPLPMPEDKLFFILVYLKNNTTQTLHGQLFSLSQSNTNKWIHTIHPALNRALAACAALPARTAEDLHDHLMTSDSDDSASFFS